MSDVEELLDDDINIIDDIEELPTEPEAQDKVETPPTAEVEPEKEESTVDEGEQEEQPPVEKEAPETPTPITEDSLRSLLSDIRSEEHESSKRLDEVYRDIQSRYYPQGVSRVLTDSKTGLQIRTAQDVLDLSENPDLTIEEAERWRLVKQAELDAQVQEIESTTRKIAEQAVALERGAERVQQKYADLFKANPALERKVTAMYMKTVNIDKETNTILSAPIDLEEFYGDYLEPYQTAFLAQASPEPAPVPAPPKPAPAPSKDDRLDEHGDGGLSDSDDDDPDDFEAQLKKEFRS